MSAFQDLAGGKKVTYRQTDNGPVPVRENLRPGEMAQSILAAALTGLAGGFKAGRGKGAAGAFSAGFEAEEAAKTKQETDKKQNAQQEFQNKNVADEMTLRKAANARDQQRSIDLAHEHAMHMSRAQQDLEQGKIEFAERTTEFDQRQADRMNLLRTAGAKPLTYPDGKPVEEFNSPQEAATWANKNSALAIQSGKYNTVFEVDPVTNRYVIMQKPLSWDDPQWLGVKTDPKTNLPVKDKDGQMIPDGNFKGTNGKVEVPAGQMTPHQLYDSQTRLLDLQSKILSREEALERLKNMKRERIKDQQLQKADDEFNRAQGNPDAIDEKTGTFIVSPSSRTILGPRFIKEAALNKSIIDSNQKEMDRIGKPGPNATDEEKRQWDGMDQEVKMAHEALRQLQINMRLLARTPNVADVTANNVRQQFTNDAGAYDEKAALASVDKMTAPSAVKQQIRQRLSSELPNRPPEQLEAVLKSKAFTDMTKEQQLHQINTAPLSKSDKQTLLQRINSGGPATSKELQNVAPEDTLIVTPSGGRQVIPNEAVEEFLKNHPNSTVVGQGTKNPTPEENFGSR
jgi:hypothetical protein